MAATHDMLSQIRNFILYIILHTIDILYGAGLMIMDLLRIIIQLIKGKINNQNIQINLTGKKNKQSKDMLAPENRPYRSLKSSRKFYAKRAFRKIGALDEMEERLADYIIQ